MPNPLKLLAIDLARHVLWSDALMYDALAKLPEEELLRTRPSLFKNMLHTMNHMVVINHIWQCHLLEQKHPYAARNTPEHPPLSELREKHLKLDQWYVDWFDEQNDDSLMQMVAFEIGRAHV